MPKINPEVSLIPMRRLIPHMLISLALILLSVPLARAEYTDAPDEPPRAAIIPGTETPKVKECPGSTAYIYKVYTVVVERSPAFYGNDHYIYKPRKNGANPCKLSPQNSYFTINAGEFGGSNTFAGIYGDLVFLDQWTGYDRKRMVIYDLAKKSIVHFDWFLNPSIDDGVLSYDRSLKASRSTRDKIPCPEAGKWRDEGLSVKYIEAMSVNLETMDKRKSGNFSCTAVAPVKNAKPSRYGGG